MAELTDVAAAAKEVVAAGADEVAETATEFADAARAVPNIRLKFAMIGAAAGLAAGAAIGWAVAYRRLESKFEQISQEEIDGMREHFKARLAAKEEQAKDITTLKDRVAPYAPTPEDADTPVADGPQPAPVAERETPEVRNVFDDPEPPIDEWNQAVENAQRAEHPGVPYVIHKDEFGEKDYTESTLTYYAGDDVLADERDKAIDDQDMVVGVQNLGKFGHGSGDANLVYIRNDELGIDVEVARSEQLYAEAVHGFKHSDLPPRRGTPRRRPRDD